MEYHIYYHDLYDHTIRLLEHADVQHDVIADMLDLHLSTLNYHLSSSLKILTLFASLFIPLTFLANLFAMNFKNMPGANWQYAYPVMGALMLIILCAMLYYFKRKKLF